MLFVNLVSALYGVHEVLYAALGVKYGSGSRAREPRSVQRGSHFSIIQKTFSHPHTRYIHTNTVKFPAEGIQRGDKGAIF